jgi:hypothetical protein
VQFDEVDLIILDILGSDSPMIEGLAVPDPPGSNLIWAISMAFPESPQSILSVPSLEPQSPSPISNSTKQKNRVNSSLDDQESILRKKRIEVQIEDLELDHIKKKLEIMEYEQLILLSKSIVTINFLSNIIVLKIDYVKFDFVCYIAEACDLWRLPFITELKS